MKPHTFSFENAEMIVSPLVGIYNILYTYNRFIKRATLFPYSFNSPPAFLVLAFLNTLFEQPYNDFTDATKCPSY